MKRMLLLASLFFLTAGSASADYLLIKINVNQLDFFPQALQDVIQKLQQNQPAPGPGVPPVPQPPPPGGVPGIPGAQPPMPGVNPPVPADPNAKWVSAFVELRTNPVGIAQPFQKLKDPTAIYKYDHKYGREIWMTVSPHYPMYASAGPFPKKTYAVEFDELYRKESKDKSKRDPEDVAKGYLAVARNALARASIPLFHKAMKEVVDASPKHPAAREYLRVKKELDKEFKEQDPAQSELLDKLKAERYEKRTSKSKHYTIYTEVIGDEQIAKVINRQLNLLENTLEIFYYWYVLQGNQVTQPALPKYHLNVLLTKDKEQFLAKHQEWGQIPMVADGFTPRRENIIVLCAKPRVMDPRYDEFVRVLKEKLNDANQKFQQKGLKVVLTPENLLNGDINKIKEAWNGGLFIGAAQTAVLVAKSMEDEAERATITNEGIRQLLIAAEVFPRNVAIPDWMVEGLAALFETPIGAVYPTVGSASWKHFISFKHLRNTNRLANASEVLTHVICDHYFQDARQLSAQALENRDNDGLRKESLLAWEMARCTAWAFVFHLAESKKMDLLMKYGKELNQLPRDMDLDEYVLRACFAKGFDLATDPRDPRRIDTKRFILMADAWYSTMQVTNLPLMDVQPYLMKLREEQDGDTVVKTAPAVPPVVDPNPPLMPAPNAPPATLDNTHWHGKETLAGYGALKFHFQANGQVQMTDKDGTSAGTFNQQNNMVTLTFYGGDVVYTGTLNGQTIAGNARKVSSNVSWTFSVTHNAPAAKGPQNNPPRPPVRRPPPRPGVRPPGF